MLKDHCLYMSCLKINNCSDNSMAQLFDGRYIKIVKFIVDTEKKQELTLYHAVTVSTDSLCDISIELLKTVSIINYENLEVIETAQIRSVCVFFEIYMFAS